jgi:hypothetical protein
MIALQTKPTGQNNIVSIDEKYLTTAEVCAKLGGITEGRVRQLVKEGRLNPQKFGRVNVFDAEEVAALAAQDRKPGRPSKKEGN